MNIPPSGFVNLTDSGKCSRMMLLHQHALLPVGCLDLPDVGVDIRTGKVFKGNSLGEIIGVKIRGLLGNDDLFHDLMGGNNPAKPHTGRKDLRERSGDDGLVRNIFAERWQGYAGEVQFAIGIIFNNKGSGSFKDPGNLPAAFFGVRDTGRVL